MIDRIYLGDRALKGIEFDLWNKQVRLQINLISRLAHGEIEWGFYEDEDLEDGFLVFSDVNYFNIAPDGAIPDDYILSFKTEGLDKDFFESVMVVGGQMPNSINGGVDDIGECHIQVRYKDSWIEDKHKQKKL